YILLSRLRHPLDLPSSPPRRSSDLGGGVRRSSPTSEAGVVRAVSCGGGVIARATSGAGVSGASTAGAGVDGAKATCGGGVGASEDRKSTRLNSSHLGISYAVFCLKK